jgi:hypothetical protein
MDEITVRGLPLSFIPTNLVYLRCRDSRAFTKPVQNFSFFIHMSLRESKNVGFVGFGAFWVSGWFGLIRLPPWRLLCAAATRNRCVLNSTSSKSAEIDAVGCCNHRRDCESTSMFALSWRFAPRIHSSCIHSLLECTFLGVNT